MKNIRKVLLMLAVVLLCNANVSYSQIDVVVRTRPHVPHYERVTAPSPRHVWVDEDWEPRGGSYVFIGGHWIEPPNPGVTWIPGHWKERRHGWVWIPGHWR